MHEQLGIDFKTVASLISRKRLPSRDKIASSHCRLPALNASDLQKFSNISELEEFVVFKPFFLIPNLLLLQD